MNNREIKKSVKDIRETLLARIIPDMPLEGDTREYITKIINQFEFEWYLEQIEKKTTEKIFRKLEKIYIWVKEGEKNE